MSQWIIIISPNEVFSDIMVLASPPPPVDDVNYSTYLFQILYMGRYPPEVLCYWNLIPSEDYNNWVHSQTTLVSPKSSKCNISITNGPIAFKFYSEVKNPKLHDTCIPQIFEMKYLHE